jgi:hypothetical protein
MCLLVFLAPPKLTREPEDQRIPLGETLKVKIPITGKGPFTFKVKKDDQSLPDDDRVRVQEYDDFIIVTIPGLYFTLYNQFLIYKKFIFKILNEKMLVNMPSMLQMILVHVTYH